MNTKVPRCGSLIKFFTKIDGQNAAEFIFTSKEVEKFLNELKKNSKDSVPYPDDAELILKWINQRDDNLSEATYLPPEFGEYRNFDGIVDELVRGGLGRITCLKCSKQQPLGELRNQDEHRLSGWSYNRLVCTEGHPLIYVETMHILRRRRH